MDIYLGLLISIILLAIAGYTLYQEASLINLLSTFFVLSFTAYFVIYVIDIDLSVG